MMATEMISIFWAPARMGKRCPLYPLMTMATAAAVEELTREEGSNVADNVRSRGIREMQPSYPGDEKMQAGIGGEKELSVIISYQFLVFSESRRKSVWWGRRWLRSKCKVEWQNC